MGPCFALLCAVLAGAPADPEYDVQVRRADEKALLDAHLKTDRASLLQFFHERTLSQAEQDELSAQIQLLGAPTYAAREQALARLIKGGERARPLLRDALKNGDPEIARRAAVALKRLAASPDLALAPAAARLLGAAPAKQAPEVLLAYLPFTDDSVADVIRQVLASMAFQDGGLQPALVAALKDPLPAKRAAAGAALARSGSDAGKTAALPLLKDPLPAVRLPVALALIDARQKQAVPVLIDLLEKLPAESCWQIRDLLWRIAGDDGPRNADGEISSARERELWQAWWQKHQAGVDLARLQESAPLLGYTLLTQLDASGAKGEVLEIDRGKTVRWRITNVRYPLDAQIVSKDRVLIAEYLDRRVTERDFQGNIHWEKQVMMPVSCQRLPNGHVFIATRRQLLEVDREGKDVFSYTPARANVAAARKLPGGQMVLITSTGQCEWLDRAGKSLKQFSVGPVYSIGGHIDILPGGRVLIPEYRQNKVVEYDRDGKAGWEIHVLQPTCAVRLSNGHTLVASTFQKRILEFDRDGREVWQFTTEGRPWCARRR